MSFISHLNHKSLILMIVNVFWEPVKNQNDHHLKSDSRRLLDFRHQTSSNTEAQKLRTWEDALSETNNNSCNIILENLDKVLNFKTLFKVLCNIHLTSPDWTILPLLSSHWSPECRPGPEWGGPIVYFLNWLLPLPSAWIPS